MHVLRVAAKRPDVATVVVQCPIVDGPATVAAVTVPGAMQGWSSTISPGGSFKNRVGAADVLHIAVTRAKRTVRRIRAPLLVCVSEHETLIDPRHAEDVARRAPHGEARHYAGDHFAIYHPPLVDDLLADQTAFLRRHLHVT